jgi:Ca2+-binding EF-hand superfamily protein
LNEFLSAFSGVKSSTEGLITRDEWIGYYTDLAMTIPSDEYFVRMIEHTWGVSEDEQSAIFQDEVRKVISMLRQRLITLSKNSYEEFTLRTIFKQFDFNQSGTITIDELAAMLAKLGIMVERKYIQAMMKKLDTNHSGVIEFEEFATLMVYDPYK